MPRKNTDPWRKVVESELHSGGTSIFPSRLPLGSEWELTLECGHVVPRAVRYRPLEEGERAQFGRPRSDRGWHYRRNPDDALPAPKKVRCFWCAAEEKKQRRIEDGRKRFSDSGWFRKVG